MTELTEALNTYFSEYDIKSQQSGYKFSSIKITPKEFNYSMGDEPNSDQSGIKFDLKISEEHMIVDCTTERSSEKGDDIHPIEKGQTNAFVIIADKNDGVYSAFWNKIYEAREEIEHDMFLRSKICFDTPVEIPIIFIATGEKAGELIETFRGSTGKPYNYDQQFPISDVLNESDLTALNIGLGIREKYPELRKIEKGMDTE